MADDVPAPASRRTTRILVVAAVVLAVALGVLVTLPGRGTPTVVARATPSVTTSVRPTPVSTEVASSTDSPSPWSPAETSTASPTTTAPGATTDPTTSGATTRGATTTASRPRPTSASTTRPQTRPPTAAPGTRTSTPPATTSSAVAASPLPGFGYGDHVTLLDPAVLDRRVVDVGGAAVMQVISTSAPVTALRSASWVVRPGLADRGCISLESVSAPGSYLVSSAGRLLVANRGGGSFDGAATLCVSSPALDGTWGVSLNPWNQSAVTVTRRADGYLAVLPSGVSPRLQTFKLWAAPA